MKNLVLVSGMLLVAACSTQQVYGSLQSWQQEQCKATPDLQAQARCREQASASYETYKRQQVRDAASK